MILKPTLDINFNPLSQYAVNLYVLAPCLCEGHSQSSNQEVTVIFFCGFVKKMKRTYLSASGIKKNKEK